MGGRVDPGGANDDGALGGNGGIEAIDAPQPQAPAQPWYQRAVTPMPWEASLVDRAFSGRNDQAPMPQLPEADLSALGQESSLMSGWPAPQDPSVGSVKPTPRALPTNRGPRGPVVEGDAKTNPVTRGPKTALALHFARAMGFAVPGTPDSTDELKFAKAAHQALLRLTKGMTVAKFLQSHQSPKTKDAFGKLLDQYLAKDTQSAQQTPGVVEPPTNASPAPLSMFARPPVQPGG